jgi:pimeloyl-ACP methyl ester carboxylesterase
MPFLRRGETSTYYEEYGSGYPVLLFAPGSLESTIDFWHSCRWDPTVELADDYRVIAMDQRNAGRSRAPILATDGWDSFLQDHIALLDHLDVRQAHLMGGCIGVSFALRLIQEQPWRVSAAVLQDPSGAITPRTRSGGFERWAQKLADHPEATDAVLSSYRDNLYRQAFVYSVTQEFVRTCETPMLVLPGNDDAHPFEVAKELADLAPNAEFIPDWKEPAKTDEAFRRAREFLRSHTPVESR